MNIVLKKVADDKGTHLVKVQHTKSIIEMYMEDGVVACIMHRESRLQKLRNEQFKYSSVITREVPGLCISSAYDVVAGIVDRYYDSYNGCFDSQY